MMCEELGEKLVTNPYHYLPQVRAALDEHVNSLEDLGPILRHSEFRRGRGRDEQPYKILDSEWLRTDPAACTGICTVNLFETDFVSLTAFTLPPGTNLPLHDHPGMHVLCKVLSNGGPLQHWSYDWDLDGARSSESEEGMNGVIRLDERLHQHRQQEQLLWKNAQLRMAKLHKNGPLAPTSSIVPVGESAMSNSGAAGGGVGQPVVPDILKPAIKPERRIEDIQQLIQHLRSAHLHGLRKSMLGRAEEVMPNAVLVSSGQVGGGHRGPLDPPGEVTWIRPMEGGILHRFSATATQPTCFVDIITPPYYRGGTGNIPCTYFSTNRPPTVAPATPIAIGDRACLRPLPGPPGPLYMEGHTAGYLIA